jgi:putative sterol carrier protein
MLSASQTGFMLEIASFAAKSPGNLVAAMIDAWCDYNGKILDFEAAHPESTFRIRYEDVVLDPAAALRPLFDFLEVGWEPQVVEKALETPHDEGGGDLYIKFTRAIDRGGIGKGSTIPFFRIQPALAPMNALLARLGYPTVGPDWNERPSPYLPAEVAAAAETAAQAAAAPADGSGTGQAAEDLADYFLKRLPEALASRAAEAAKANASVKFVVSDGELGAEPGIFWVELRGQPRVLAEDRPADCTLTLPREVLFDIAGRKLNPVAAFSQNRIKVQGPLPLAAHMMRFV